MEKEIKVEKQVVLKRVPPGDRWAPTDSSTLIIYPTLTDALEGHYQNTGETKFYMDARKGIVEVINEVEVEKPQKRFSLYGED